MAVTVTVVRTDEPGIHQWDIIASADADTGASFGHVFGFNPLTDPYLYLWWSFNPVLAAGALSAWGQSGYTGPTNNNVSLRKLTGAGSGDAAIQVRVTACRPHSLIR